MKIRLKVSIDTIGMDPSAIVPIYANIFMNMHMNLYSDVNVIANPEKQRNLEFRTGKIVDFRDTLSFGVP
jgi:hypothetical protein